MVSRNIHPFDKWRGTKPDKRSPHFAEIKNWLRFCNLDKCRIRFALGRNAPHSDASENPSHAECTETVLLGNNSIDDSLKIFLSCHGWQGRAAVRRKPHHARERRSFAQRRLHNCPVSPRLIKFPIEQDHLSIQARKCSDSKISIPTKLPQCHVPVIDACQQRIDGRDLSDRARSNSTTSGRKPDRNRYDDAKQNAIGTSAHRTACCHVRLRMSNRRAAIVTAPTCYRRKAGISTPSRLPCRENP